MYYVYTDPSDTQQRRVKCDLEVLVWGRKLVYLLLMSYTSTSQGEEWRNLKTTEFLFHRTWDTSNFSFIPRQNEKAKCPTRWNSSKTLTAGILTALLIALRFPKADGNHFCTTAHRVDLLSQKVVSNHTKD